MTTNIFAQSFMKISFVNEYTASYLRWKHRHEPTSVWHNTQPGLYVGGDFVTDFFLRRTWNSYQRHMTDPTFFGLMAVSSVALSKSNVPRDITKKVIFDIVLALVIMTVVAVPFFVGALLGDLTITYYRLNKALRTKKAEYEAKVNELMTRRPENTVAEASHYVALHTSRVTTPMLEYIREAKQMGEAMKIVDSD